jgi:vacuolar-type H+-ATPase subunit H
MVGPGPDDYRGGSDMGGGDHHVQAAKVLGLAQEMADRLTAEAKSEADSMLSDARNKSEQLLSDARAKSDGLVNDARSRAETMLNDARTRAETLERQSRDKAAQLVGDAERKQTEIIGSITRDKSVLEKKIDELRTFEREYRTRLKTYLESQLRDLEGRGTAAPADSRAAANGGYAASGYGQRADAGS